MKLLRDFLRLRTAGRFPLAARRNVVRVPRTVTVPQPLTAPATGESARTSRHLHLVSSH
jgi:hypothetical protein